MKTRFVAVTCFVALLALVALSQTAPPGFEMATVVSIDKVPADARHPENANQYKIAIAWVTQSATATPTGRQPFLLTGVQTSSSLLNSTTRCYT